MLGWLFFAASAYAAYLWGNWIAIGVAVVNFWSLGMMHNHAEETGPSGPIRNNYESFVINLNMLSSLAGLGLLVAAFCCR
jgi:hypothetical protein